MSISAPKHGAKRTPASVIYGLDEYPPVPIVLLNGVQHVGLIAINLVYPVLIFRAVDAPVEVVSNLLGIGMLVLAVATFLQVYRIGPVGTGYMCPATFTATYFAPSLLAAKAGGLPLVFGMTIFAGLLEVFIAPLLNRLRTIFPPEISGVIIVTIGLSAGLAALRSLVGPTAEPVGLSEWAVAGFTLAVMAAFNVWGNKFIRMLCALLGLIAGYLAAGAAGLFGNELAAVGHASWVGAPSVAGMSWSVEMTMIVPFAIASIAAAMKAAGTITVCQRINDANWVRPDIRSVTGGVLADGLSTAIAGLAGAVGTNTSTPAVGLSAATGVTSRVVAIAVGGIFLVMGFFPKLTALLAVMPRSVILPALLFTVTFIIVNGLQILTSRLLDARRTLVIGLSLVSGVAIEAFPGIPAMMPASIAPIIGSSLVFASLVAFTLNLLFRIGVRQTASLSIESSAVDHQAISDFFALQTAAWGARPEIASRATYGAIQLVDVVAEEFWTDGPLVVEASFDEFNLDVRVTYRGVAPIFPDRRPSNEQIRTTEDGAKLLAGFMLRRNADRVRAESKDGIARVHFHFDH